MIRALICGVFLLCGACSVTRFGNTFEGSNDYRIIPPPATLDAAPAGCAARMQRPATHTVSGDAHRTAFSLGCFSRFQTHPQSAQDLSDDKSFLRQGDKISLFIKNVVFAEFTESGVEEVSNSIVTEIFGASPVKGEIAILANVTQNARSPGGVNADGQLEGKVVYYGNDIYRGQLANEFYIPISGPDEWKGGPLTVDLWMLELDQAENQQLGSMLKTLASLSSKFTALTAGGGQVLNQVGTAFLNSNRDDVIGHITLTLVPPTAGHKTTDPLLRVSDIIIHRNEGTDRGRGVSFDHCYYEPLQTKVYCGPDNDVPDRNAMVVAIRRSVGTANLLSDVSLQALNDRLQKASSRREVNEIIEQSADEAAIGAQVETAQAAIDRIADPSTPDAVRSYDAEQIITLLQCALVAERKVQPGASDAVIQAAETMFANYCGPRLSRRSISIDDFNLVGRRIVDKLTVESGDLSADMLIGDMALDSLKTQRSALLPKFKPRASLAGG